MMLRLTMLTILLGAVLAPAQTLTFEVASVKRSGAQGAGVQGGCHGIDSKYTPNQIASAPPLGRCVITDGRLGHFIGIAWKLSVGETITGGPDWVTMENDRFTIEAEAANPATATEAQLLEMLQNLLVERFKLKYHRQEKAESGYALVVGRNGPKLGAAKSEDSILDLGPEGKASLFRGPANLAFRKYSMKELANLLTGVSREPVVDETGLAGEYDFKLAWDETNGPALTTAVQEQLGLKLEPKKVTVSLFVVDAAEKPDEN
jgi:uncharacterized protein (TIGR03435 family)